MVSGSYPQCHSRMDLLRQDIPAGTGQKCNRQNNTESFHGLSHWSWELLRLCAIRYDPVPWHVVTRAAVVIHATHAYDASLEHLRGPSLHHHAPTERRH